MWLLVFLGCANNISALYEQEKAMVMASPPPLGKNWDSEFRLRFSDQALQTLLRQPQFLPEMPEHPRDQRLAAVDDDRDAARRMEIPGLRRVEKQPGHRSRLPET